MNSNRMRNPVSQNKRLVLPVIRAHVSENPCEVRCNGQNTHRNGHVHGSLSVLGELNGYS